MCPWPRIQAALTDEWALNVTYRRDRGEPRVSVKKAEQLRQHGEPAGDCIDCHQCINVCPTGVDIRDGIQLGCIQCGLCIDACDTIMSEIGRPTGLIAYDTDINGQRRQAGKPPVYRLIRARTILYAAIIALVGSIMLYALATRSSMSINVLHDRNPLYVLLADGGVRNNYTVRILNKGPERTFALDVSGLPGRGPAHPRHRARRRWQARGRRRTGSNPRNPPVRAGEKRDGAPERRRHRDQGDRHRHRTNRF